MNSTEEKLHIHDGCPNRSHCKKDETQCCYLVKNHCILGRDDIERILL